MADYSEYRGRELRGSEGIANSILAKRLYPGQGRLSFFLVEGENDEGFYILTQA